MGSNALKVSMGVSGVSAFILLLCAWGLPFHTLRWFALQGLGGALFTVQTYLVSAHVEEGSFIARSVCNKIKSSFGDLCGTLTGGQSLQQVSAAFCTPVAKTTYPTLCEGYRAAQMGGVAVLFATILLFGAFGTAAWLSHHYMDSPKKKYRETAFVLMCSGPLLHVCALFFYCIFSIMKLEDVHSHPIAGLVIQPDNTTGVDKGVFFSWIAVIFNVIAIILYTNAKLKEEDTYLEVRRQREFEAEVNAEQQQQQQQNYGQGEYGYQPGAQGAYYYTDTQVNYTMQTGLAPPTYSMQPGVPPPGDDFGIASGPHPA